MNTIEKLQSLRSIMRAENIHACIIPTSDAHISEYPPEHWKTRQWISGFTGSAGIVVVTLDKAGLWTDSRYFLQAEEQLKNSGIELFKMGLEGVPSYSQWLIDILKQGDVIGFEGEVFAASEAKPMIELFRKNNLKVNADFAPYNKLWVDRPFIPADKAFVLPEEFAGQSVRNKIEKVLNEVKKKGGNVAVLASLDQIAWLFNIRGNDIEYNPSVVSYAVVSEKESLLFVDHNKLTEQVVEYLRSNDVLIGEYTKIEDYIKTFNKEDKVVLAPGKINYKLYDIVAENSTVIAVDVHPVDSLKGIKNQTEIAGFRNAMIKDGVALIKFWIDLERHLSNGIEITEMNVATILYKYRSEQQLFVSESFSTIAGYNEHGAIVHYEADEETNTAILPKGMLLIDSGAQYFDGTTDITRTIGLGNVSDEMKKDYTLVLKGNIQLSRAIFPKGTIGMQLDILARQFLWQEGQNYLHGTGHGIGHFLNVHEGPQSIRMNYNPVSLEPGMITSNEPGIYKSGKYGIRIENLLLVEEQSVTDFGEYYSFETLTLCPIDTSLIDKSLMSVEEVQWLNNYHQKVFDKLSPYLSEEETSWLKQKTVAV